MLQPAMLYHFSLQITQGAAPGPTGYSGSLLGFSFVLVAFLSSLRFLPFGMGTFTPCYCMLAVFMGSTLRSLPWISAGILDLNFSALPTFKTLVIPGNQKKNCILHREICKSLLGASEVVFLSLENSQHSHSLKGRTSEGDWIIRMFYSGGFMHWWVPCCWGAGHGQKCVTVGVIYHSVSPSRVRLFSLSLSFLGAMTRASFLHDRLFHHAISEFEPAKHGLELLKY